MQNQILFVTLFSFLMSDVLMVKIPCNQQSKNQLDENVMKLGVLGDPKGKYPATDKEAILHSKEDLKMTSWGRNYSATCMTRREVETSHHVTNLLMYSMSSVAKKRSRSESARKVFINAGKCGNLVQDDTIKCYNQYILESEQINISKKTRIANDKHLLPLICCAYHKFYDCCSDVYSNPSYAKTCTQKATVELEAYIRESLYDVIQYLCGDYQGSNDKCDRLRNQYKDMFESVKIKTLRKSPLGPANDVFDSLPPVGKN